LDYKYLCHFLGPKDISVTFWLQGHFSNFLFQGHVVIFFSSGYFGHFLSFMIIPVIFFGYYSNFGIFFIKF